MYVNVTKRKMMQGRPAIGAEVSLGSPLSAELISSLGYDFVLVDNQHGLWTEEQSMIAFRSISLGVSTPMARVRRNDYGSIGRLLDMGCMGIVVPMVNTAEEAAEAVFATRFPPKGGRSIGPFATGFLGENYDAFANDEIFLAVQLETGEAAENAESIMSVEGIDGCWIGPGDLGRFMGVDFGSDIHTKTIINIINVCEKVGKIAGISNPSSVLAKRWIDEGCLFVTTGADAQWIVDKARETLHELR